MQFLSGQQSRRVDQLAITEFGMSSLVLMENAGRGAADLMERLGLKRTNRIIICSGKGNNGGDGFVRTGIGLGYDLRHWILEGNAKQIPWRIWFYTPDTPEYVQTKLQGKLGKPLKKGLQDAFAFDGMCPFFVLVPPKYLKGLERLPLKEVDKYVAKLAKAVSKFLDDLYRES
jgi:hypothetical protein